MLLRIFSRLKFLLALICVGGTGVAKTVNGAERPNVLFIAVDDWNDWVGAYGNKQAQTPNLDKLATRGVMFRNAHTSAVYCAPSRTSVMTGMNPHTTGAYTDEPHFASVNHPGLKDLPLWFHDHGYYVAGGGKIYHHMPGFIDMRGWDEYFTLWERTSNVPFIWSGPGIVEGAAIDTTVSLLDTYPTLTELCGLPTNRSNEGVSLASVLTNPEIATDRTVLQSDHNSFSLINSQWRYTRYSNGEEELYDVAKDPGEHQNLADDPDHRDTIEKLAIHLPANPSLIGRSPGPTSEDLRLQLMGESFQWVEKRRPSQ